MKYLFNKLIICAGFLIFSAPVAAQQLFKGQTVDGLREGAWVLYHPQKNVKVAEGDYSSGKKTGQWKYYFTSFAQKIGKADVVGYYENGVKQGKWAYRDVTNKKSSLFGSFENGKMVGVWTYRNSAGELVGKGEFKNGFRNGEWFTYRNGLKKEHGFFENGKKVGIWTEDWKSKDGKLRTEGKYEYVNGRRNGTWKVYKTETYEGFEPFEDLAGTGQYSNGNKNARWVFYDETEKGATFSRGTYVNGEKNGLWKTDLNDKKHEEIEYQNGKRHGTYKIYYPNGNVQYECTYVNDHAEGPFAEYYENGLEKVVGELTSGHVVGGDTLYVKVKLPLEFAFEFTDREFSEYVSFQEIDWDDTPDIPMDKLQFDAELARINRVGTQPKAKGLIPDHSAVRVNAYSDFHENGELKSTGNYLPKAERIYIKSLNTFKVKYYREGEWKLFDKNGYMRRRLVYEDGKVIEDYKE